MRCCFLFSSYCLATPNSILESLPMKEYLKYRACTYGLYLLPSATPPCLFVEISSHLPGSRLDVLHFSALPDALCLFDKHTFERINIDGAQRRNLPFPAASVPSNTPYWRFLAWVMEPPLRYLRIFDASDVFVHSARVEAALWYRKKVHWNYIQCKLYGGKKNQRIPTAWDSWMYNPFATVPLWDWYAYISSRKYIIGQFHELNWTILTQQRAQGKDSVAGWKFSHS